MIAFIGSVFSPYYAWARRHRAIDPLNHCAVNIALYGTPRRWAMTERGRMAVRQSATMLSIGPSSLHWDGNVLTAEFDEIGVPWPSHIRGRVQIYPTALPSLEICLAASGKHRWSPIAPCARVEVTLTQPRLAWRGSGYLDTNRGDAPLEQGFARWSWSRTAQRDGTTIFYDVVPRAGEPATHAYRLTLSGVIEPLEPPPMLRLPATRWGVARATRATAPPTSVRTLEDTPFYARSLIEAPLFGEPVVAMHESLSLDRFRAPWVRALLPFRMPRRAG